MSRFAAIMQNKGLPAFKRFFGDPVTLQSDGRVIMALVEQANRYIGEVADVPQVGWKLTCARADWPSPKRGDQLTHAGKNYRVDRPELAETDEYFTVAWLVAA
ncbi:MAG TPA: hypothetical protein DCQ84_13995 [Candidatus Competibacteraceae bacterium]|nr:hypothetical protein [Candidatus Competibacteraceae bacterium]